MADTWYGLYDEDHMIEKKTPKAWLIRMPRSSKYAGYAFWHPAKCCSRKVKGFYGELDAIACEVFEIRYTLDWTFRLKDLYGIEPDVELTIAQLKASLDPERPWMHDGEEHYSTVHIPKHLDPVEPRVLEELIDDDD